jgi:hypothetical protein
MLYLEKKKLLWVIDISWDTKAQIHSMDRQRSPQ